MSVNNMDLLSNLLNYEAADFKEGASETCRRVVQPFKVMCIKPKVAIQA